MRFAIVIGHRKSRQGARGVSGVHEWAWNIPLGGRLVGQLEAAGFDADLLFRPDRSGGALSELVRRINADDYDAIVSLHFNALNGEVSGHEQLHHPASTRGAALARACSAAHVEALPGIRDRGTRGTTVNGAGTELYILTKSRAPATIVESHFGDHAPDHEEATANRDRLADALGAHLADLGSRVDAGGAW